MSGQERQGEPPPDNQRGTASRDVEYLVSYSVLFLLLLLVLQLMLAVPGARVTYYAILAGLAVLPALHGSRAFGIWAVMATLIAVAFTIWDYEEGKKYRPVRVQFLEKQLEKQIEELREKAKDNR